MPTKGYIQEVDQKAEQLNDAQLLHLSAPREWTTARCQYVLGRALGW